MTGTRASIGARTRRVESMMHALLVDHGFRREVPERGCATLPRLVYYHPDKPLTGAVLERTSHPGLAVAVTLLESERAVAMASRPESLRVLLERGIV